ncbi:MAG: DUF11 domain-containing protein, partial [Eubacterium sp.]|nr:DUF11 domain-containing protein [Eubacterium sp.]
MSIIISTARPENYILVSAADSRDKATVGDATLNDATKHKKSDKGSEEKKVESEEGEKEEKGDNAEKELHIRVEKSGCDITILAPKGSLPYPEDELSVTAEEILPDTAKYNEYLNASADALNCDGKESISFARFFDIEILHDGEKIEPESPVEVKIEYDKAPEIPEGAEMSIVHFADEGTEVIEEVELNEDATEIVYEQESFSVTATVVTNPTATEAGKKYVLVAKYTDPESHQSKVYIVQGDGTLTEVSSYVDGASGISSVETNSPMMWTYTTDGGKTYLQYNADGYDFDWTNQATNFAKGYIDPTNVKGFSKEGVDHVDPVENPEWWEPKTKTYFDNTKEHCDIVVDDQKHIYHLEGGSNYSFISVDPDQNILIGGLTPFDEEQLKQINTTEFYLADVDNNITELTDQEIPFYHMVNHIDISVSDEVETEIDLAYGTYYDVNGNPILTITKDSPSALKKTTVKKEVNVKQEYLRKASIETFCNGNPIDDVFCITGYSSNVPSGYSGTQVRIEGRFKVANLPKVDWYSPNSEDAMINRMKPENQIRYRITAVQPQEEFIITHPQTGEPLYDIDHNPITEVGDVSITAEFGYWDYDPSGATSSNECPPIQSGEDFTKWRNGAILSTGTSGMDFKLIGTSKANLDPVAIEIKKTIQDTEGNPIIPASPIEDISFDVYENIGANSDKVIDLNVGSYSHDADYTGYVKTSLDRITITSDDSNKGTAIFNDHSISQGMVYIDEDKSTIPDEFVDKDGNVWIYKNTFIETEYVWRQDGDEGKKHISKTYTKADDSFVSVPEVLGAYGDELFNGFLEFDCYNVYEQYVPEKKEIDPYEGKGKLGGVNVGDEITYEISYKNYKSTAADIKIKDTLDPNVEFVSASNDGTESSGVVNWTIANVAAGAEGTVTLKVKVLNGALKSEGGPGKVINGGDNATVQVGDDPEYKLDLVENPVPKTSEKKETAPYEGTGELGAVKVGDEITYEISYKNYKEEATDIVIKDTLDPNVEFVSASDGGSETSGVVNWTLSNVAAGTEGVVTLTVKVL